MAWSKNKKTRMINRFAFLFFFLLVAGIFMAVLITMLVLSEGPDLKGEPVTHSRTTDTLGVGRL